MELIIKKIDISDIKEKERNEVKDNKESKSINLIDDESEKKPESDIKAIDQIKDKDRSVNDGKEKFIENEEKEDLIHLALNLKAGD